MGEGKIEEKIAHRKESREKDTEMHQAPNSAIYTHMNACTSRCRVDAYVS